VSPGTGVAREPLAAATSTGAHGELLKLKAAMAESIIGQDAMVERLLLGLIADGHLLVEGLPGLAKTRAIKALAKHLDAKLSRVQFTPDLLPADITGSDVYDASGGAFHFREGPIFANLVLADEVNRAPAKVQAALLEAMEERQVTVAGQTHPLPSLFLVMATENPIEQEGTYQLPEAQLDRFLMHVRVGYPDAAAEGKIVELNRREERGAAPAAASSADAPVPDRPSGDARLAGRDLRRACGGACSHGRRGRRDVHRRTDSGDARAGGVRQDAGRLDPGGREPARHDRARSCVTCLCLVAGPRSRHHRRTCRRSRTTSSGTGSCSRTTHWRRASLRTRPSTPSSPRSRSHREATMPSPLAALRRAAPPPPPRAPDTAAGVHASAAHLAGLEGPARQLVFRPRHPAHNLLAGRHGSRVRGRGLDFEELRHYQPGDDVRSIDWPVTARMPQPFVRVYTEEKDRPTTIVVDQRINMFFGTRLAMKSFTAAEAAALCAWRAVTDGDRVAGIVFDDAGIHHHRAERSRGALLRLLGRIAGCNAALRADTSVARAPHTARRGARCRCAHGQPRPPRRRGHRSRRTDGGHARAASSPRDAQ
jgi:hypothetical protein